MDYEFRIALAEKELAHLREMQQFTRAHLDAHDDALKVVADRFERIDQYLEKIAEAQAQTAIHLARTDAQLAALGEKFNGLIDALTRSHGNGS